MAVAVLSLHKPERVDPRLRCPVLAIRDTAGTYGDNLYHLGFMRRAVSGKRDRGGPGHRVAGLWVVPLSRWEHDPILRAQVDVLFARVNGGPSSGLIAAKARLKEVLSGRTEAA